MRQSYVPLWAFCALLLLTLGLTTPAFATETSGGSMPWDSPLENVLESIRGPVAYAVSIIGLVTAGATLIWGGEISEFTRRIIYLVLVISLIALADQAYSAIFSGGALI